MVIVTLKEEHLKCSEKILNNSNGSNNNNSYYLYYYKCYDSIIIMLYIIINITFVFKMYNIIIIM